MKCTVRFSLSLIMSILPFFVFSQHYEKEEQITFNYGFNPVKIEVETNNEKYIFYAKSSSYHPYYLEIEFTQIQNLIPYMTKQSFVVSYGSNRLFELTKKEQNQPHHYNYKFNVRLGDPNVKPDLNFPYSLPLAVNKQIKPEKLLLNDSTYLITNYLKVDKNDTVFCIRKGYITAIGGSISNPNVIIRNSSVEVRHMDGTIAVYNNIDPSFFKLKQGQNVYAGQPIGVSSLYDRVSVSLFVPSGDGRLSGSYVKYFVGKDSLKSIIDLQGCTVSHYDSLFNKELNKRELKLKSKGKLF